MRTLNNILNDLDYLCDQLENIKKDLEENKFNLPKDFTDKLGEKHISLAIKFGVLETTFNRVASLRPSARAASH